MMESKKKAFSLYDIVMIGLMAAVRWFRLLWPIFRS